MSRIRDVLGGGFGAARISAPLSSEACAAAADALGAPTFSHPDLPSCWGAAFENYATMAEYLDAAPPPPALAPLCARFEADARARLRRHGLRTERLRHHDGRPWPLSNVRQQALAPSTEMLHLDDLRQDGSVKADFVLPAVLAGGFIQVSFFCWLQAAGSATLRLHDRPYHGALDRHRLANGWQFAPEAVAGARHEDLHPRTGQHILMANQHLHDILGGATPSRWTAWSMYALVVPATRTAYLYI